MSPYDFADSFLVTTTVNTSFLHTDLTNYKPYHYRVFAVDRQGNSGNYADTTNNAPIDITAPVMGTISSPSHPESDFWYADANPKLLWSASDSGGSGVNGYYYMLSAVSDVTVEQLMSQGVYTASAGVILQNVGDALWYFHVMAIDNQGNQSGVQSYVLRIDHFPAPPADIASVLWNGRINLSWTAPSPDPGDIDYYRVYCDSTSPYDFEDSFIATQTITTAFAHNGLQVNSTYYYRLTTVDAGPNVLESTYSAITGGQPLDNVPPAMLTLNSPSHPFEEQSYQNNVPTFTWTASDVGGADIAGYYYALDTLASATTTQLVAAGTFTYINSVTITGVADGTWNFHILPIDYQNNIGSVLSRRIIVNLPPAAPTGLVMSTSAGHVNLSWTPPSPFPADFGYYKVYCDSSTPYDFSDAFVAGSTGAPVFVDTVTAYLSYRYRVTTVDNGATPLESSFTNDQFLVQTDTMVPVMQSLGSPTHPVSNNWYSNTKPKMEFTAQDFGSAGMKGYYIMWSASATLSAAQIISGGLFTDATYYQQMAVLDDGEWYFHVVAQDNADNPSVPMAYRLRIDTLPPSPAGLTAIAGQNQIAVSWSSAAPGDFSAFILYCDSTTTDFSASVIVTETVSGSFVHTGLTNYAVHRYRVAIKDTRGNISPTSDEINLYPIDTTPPSISWLTSSNMPVQETWYAVSSPTYSWSAADTGGSGLRGYYYYITQSSDTIPAAAAEFVRSSGAYTSSTTVTLSDLADSLWFFYLTAEDNEGNLSPLSTYYTRVDFPPGAPQNLTAIPAEGRIALNWEPPAVSSADVTAYRVYCDSVAPYDFADGFILAQATGTTNYAHLNLNPATTYYYRVTALDAPPNVLEGAYSSIISALPVGSLAISSIASPTHPSTSVWYSSQAPSFNWTVEGNGGVGISTFSLMITTYSVTASTVAADGVQLAGNVFTYTSSATLADGEWIFSLLSQDMLGNMSALAEYRFRVDASTPLAPQNLAAVPAQNSIALSWSSQTDIFDIAQYRVYCDSTSPYDFADSFLAGTSSTNTFIHTGLVNFQPYHYRVAAVDGNGNISPFAGTANAATIDAEAPVITSLTSSSLPQEQAWYPDPNPVYSWTASDTGGSGLRGYYYTMVEYSSVSVSTVSADYIRSTGTYTSSTTVTLSGVLDGVWNFYLTAEDNQGNLSEPAKYLSHIDYAPGAPQNLTLLPADGRITLAWDAPAVLSADLAGYRIYCDSAAPYDFADGFVLAQTTGTTTYAHLNLNQASTYYYRLTAFDTEPNVLESDFSNSASARPVNSLAIRTLTSTTHPSTSTWYSAQIPAFNWTVEGNGGIGISTFSLMITTYAVTAGTVAADGVQLASSVFSYTSTSTLLDGEWYFSLVSQNRLGDTSMAVYPFKIDASTPPAPLNLVAVSTQNAIQLTWSSQTYAYDIDHYSIYCDSSTPFDFDNGFFLASVIASTNVYLHMGLENYQPYRYRVYAVDRNGNTSPFADTTNNAPVNTIAPVIASVASQSHPDQNLWYADNTPKITWSATAYGGSGINGYYYLLSSTETVLKEQMPVLGTFTSSAGVILQNVTDAHWYFHLVAMDNQGNMSDVNTYNVKVDYRPAPPADVVAALWSGSIRLSWAAPSPDPGDIDYYRVYIDSTSPYDFMDAVITTQTRVLSFEHNNLNPTSTYYYRVTAVDLPYNVLESSFSEVVGGLPLDSLAPSILALNSPSHPFETESYQNNIPTFTWTAEDEGGSGISGYYYKLDQLADITTSQLMLTGDLTYLNTTSYTGTVADGAWYFHVLPVDYQNNIGTVMNRKIIVNMPPAAPTGLVMSTAPAQVILNWTAPSPLPADFSHYNVYCDTAAPYDFADASIATATVYTVFIDTVTSYLSYRYRVSAVDNGAVPLESGFTNDQFLVQSDTMSPVMQSLGSPSHPVSNTWYADQRPKMEFTAVDYGGAGVKGYYIMWSVSATLTQAQILQGGSFVNTTYYQEIFGLTDGEWYFHTMAQDNVMNLSAPMVYRLRVDTLPPTPNAIDAVAGQNQITLSWGTSFALPTDFYSFIIYCDSMSVDWSRQFIATETVSSSFIHAGLKNYSVYRYRIVTKDVRGNVSPYSENVSLYPIDATKPVIDSFVSTTHPDQAVWYATNTPQYYWQASDAGGAGLKGYYFKLDNSATVGLDNLVTLGTFTITTGYAVTTPLADGAWYFHLAAVDQQDNYSDIINYATNIDEPPGPPQNLTASARDQAVTLSWQPPAPMPVDFAYYRLYIDSTTPYDFSDAFVVRVDTTE